MPASTWDSDGIPLIQPHCPMFPDPDNNGLKTLTSNTASTSITASPVVTLSDTIFITQSESEVELNAEISSTLK
ncbi:MAG: hypothetical protein R2771_00695 [Saprospiraceae bacterium]